MFKTINGNLSGKRSRTRTQRDDPYCGLPIRHYVPVTTRRCAPYYVLRRSMEHPCWQSRMHWEAHIEKHFFCEISHFQEIRYRYWKRLMSTKIKLSYHEVSVMIISSAPRKCRNHASQIEEAHAIPIGTARRGYKSHAPQLWKLHATLI